MGGLLLAAIRNKNNIIVDYYITYDSYVFKYVY